jgi:ferredoxin
MKVRVEIQSPGGQRESIDLSTVPSNNQESLLEWIETKSQIISYGCRVGSCGTCMVEVISGAENLQEMTPQEEDTLSRMRKSPLCRLACRARLKDDASGVIVLKPIF